MLPLQLETEQVVGQRSADSSAGRLANEKKIFIQSSCFLYKHITQKNYTCDPQTQLNNYDEKIIILERTTLICILYAFYVKIVYASCIILCKKLSILKTSLALHTYRLRNDSLTCVGCVAVE
jgi:hypothetical protein